MTTTLGLTELPHTFTSMASTITIRVIEPNTGAREAVQEAISVIEDVAATCTRFDPTSPLMRVNADPSSWHRVPRVLIDAVSAAHEAHLATAGAFDPRVLTALVRDGYGASRTFAEEPVIGATVEASEFVSPNAWHPGVSGDRVMFGTDPIDLGGIGKGLAVRWAAERLRGTGAGFIVDAGGDLITAGVGPDGGPWRIGVENPWHRDGDPIAVIDASDAAVATSSVRLRSWVQDGRVRHHLIDPRTGQPGGEGLVSVTVIGTDPADAEVWAKALFLAGSSGIADVARSQRLAAVWVTTDGAVHMSVAAAPRVVWSVQHAQQ